MEPPMPIIYDSYIPREALRASPLSFFVFGDNVARRGYGGQAAAMRGEPNAIGIATKWLPSNTPDAFFRDGDPSARIFLLAELNRLASIYRTGADIHVPAAGLGTGLSHLPETAPRLYALLYHFFQALSDDPCPWPKPSAAAPQEA